MTDDLYIKMNARGLELTPFERFKAAFNNKVDRCGWDAGKPVTATFAHRIDTVWTDLFWGICEQPHLTDRHIQHFVAAMAMNYYAKSYRPESREQTEQHIQQLAGDATTVNPDDFTEDGYKYLTACLDAYVPHGDADGGAASWEMSDGQRFLNLAYKDKMAYPDYVLLFAQTEYLMRQGQRTDGDDRWDRACDDWQRVVNNIVRNSTIDSPATFVAAITLVDELAEEATFNNFVGESTEILKVSDLAIPDSFKGEEKEGPIRYREPMRAWTPEMAKPYKNDSRALAEDLLAEENEKKVREILGL